MLCSTCPCDYIKNVLHMLIFSILKPQLMQFFLNVLSTSLASIYACQRKKMCYITYLIKLLGLQSP